MLLHQPNDAQLTYCTNVHPGESLLAVRTLVKRDVCAVKRRVAPDAPFGVGLRLAAAAAEELAAPGELARFKAELDAEGLYCFTLNGFPYGAFHGTRVKERVYEPDWRSPERLRYTEQLAHVLCELLPSGMSGSISTVPGCFKPHAGEPQAEERMAALLVDAAALLVGIERSTGRHIALALEPEPACLLETTADAVRFFEERLLGPDARKRLVETADVDPVEAERLLRRHLGVCLDTCHASVEFEAPLDAWRRLGAAGIAVPKVQVSTGLRLPEASAERLAALGDFAEGVYLHQTVVRSEGRLAHYLDLPEALAAGARGDAEWRVHFHVPVFMEQLGDFESTQRDLLPLLGELATAAVSPQLEVETYTWDVLPEAFRNVPLETAIARELGFVKDTLASALAGAGVGGA